MTDDSTDPIDPTDPTDSSGPTDQRAESGVDGFLWAAVQHLEARIALTDTKANILTAVTLGQLALVGLLGLESTRDGSGFADVLVATAVASNFVLGNLIIYRCLGTVNPRRRHPEHARESTADVVGYPDPYVVWPRPGQPWEEGPEAHTAAILHLSREQQRENLAFTHFVVMRLVDGKYREYRRAARLARWMVLLQLIAFAAFLIAHL